MHGCIRVGLISSVLLSMGCGEEVESTPTASATDQPCAVGESPSLVIGSGAGDTFIPLNEGDEVPLTVAPQGGFGVGVWVQTEGLQTSDAVDVLLETSIDGEISGSFLNEGISLYCQDDGSGMLWGVVVGFDSGEYSTNEDLLALDGESVDLIVTVTDTDGRVSKESVGVIIVVSN